MQVGDFNFGKEQKAIPRKPRPLLLAWPMNNYWDTNFRAQQPGFVSFRYSLSTFQRFEPVQALAAGVRTSHPVVVTPLVVCGEEASGQWIKVEGGDVVVFDVRPSADGCGMLLRLHNPGDVDTEVEISFPSTDIQNAWLTDVLEENREILEMKSDSGLRLKVKARQMLHVQVDF